MAPIRLRHPKGVSTIEIDLESGKVSDLLQAVFSCTDIPPTLQELKIGYPPQPLTLVASLPIDSLGLKRGDQLTVTVASGGPQAATVSPEASVTRQSTTPLAALASLTKGDRAEPADYVHTSDGVLMLRVVPDDNSCLFSAVGLIFEQSMDVAPKLRQLVADTILKDPITYDEAFLGRPPSDYASTILKSNSWGGAIELAIFAEHFQTEISSFDVETGRCDRFGQGKWKNRCVLMYSGIHYDAASLAPSLDSPLDFHQTVFQVSLQRIFDAASKLASILRKKKAYTNTSTFDLRCQICKKGLKGEREARQHAKETGHVEFGEY
jgi:ubiquitin thioesterase OTU1